MAGVHFGIRLRCVFPEVHGCQGIERPRGKERKAQSRRAYRGHGAHGTRRFVGTVHATQGEHPERSHAVV